MLDNVLKEINILQNKIECDTFNLTQNDHAAIAVKLNELKDFIAKTYEERRKLSGLSE